MLAIGEILGVVIHRIGSNVLDIQSHPPEQAIGIRGNVDRCASLVAEFGRFKDSNIVTLLS